MADSDKIVTITPNTSVATTHPEIKFVGKDNSPIYLKVLDDNTLSFEGTEGQVFSITPTLSSGDIFSVNDISGIQSMAINADGTITLNPTNSKRVEITGSVMIPASERIYFKSTDTYIGSDDDGSEDLHIGSDGHIELEADNDTIIKQASTELARFTSTGLGIGTTSPDAKLEVESSDGSIPGLKVYRDDATTSDALVYIHDDNAAGDNAALHVKQDSSASYGNAAIFEGHVGINNTGPIYELDITGKGGGNGELRVLRTSGAAIRTQAQSATGIIGTETNHDFALMTNGSQRVKIANDGGIEAVSTTKGWNLWCPIIFGKRDYGTTAGSGAALHSLSTTAGEAGLNSYPLPADATLRAISFYTAGEVLSGTTSQVWRLYANGSSSVGTLTDTTLDCSDFTRQNAENANSTNHWYVVDGLNASYNKGDTIAFKRESGAVDMGHIKVTLWWTFDN